MLSARCIVILVMLFGPCGVLRAELPAMPDTTPAGKPHFDAKGAQVGEQIPDLILKDLDGKAASLHDELRGPTLILTSSFTCPKSRSMFPRAAALIEKFKAEKVNLLVIYIIEAHPQGDVCPYSDVEEVTIENQRDHVLERQPRKMEERLALAEKFRQRLHVEAPMLVDEMDNMAWKSVGGGPNMGVLVDSGGIVLARQGWFDDVSMEAALKALGERRAPEVLAKKLKSTSDSDESAAKTAASKGDLEKLNALFVKWPELPTAILPDRDAGRGSVQLGGTLLQFAAGSGQLEAVRLLVEKGADVNLETRRNPAPLYLAAQNGKAEVVRFLLAHGAKPDLRRFSGTGPTALQEALIRSRADVVEVLIKSGAGADFFTDAALGHLEAVQKRVDEDSSIAVRPDGMNRTPLAYAAAGGQLKVAEALLAAGAHDISPTPYLGDREASAIWWAVENKNVPMIHLLCTHGSDPNHLSDAMFEKSPESARELLACKADPKKADLNGYFPVHMAAIHDQPEILAMLLDAGAEAGTVTGPDHAPCGSGSSQELTALHMASSAKVIAMLIKHGAKVDARDRDGSTPLHWLVGSFVAPASVLGAVKELLASGADVNAKTASGETALDRAESVIAYEKKPDRCVVEALLAHGAKHGKEIAVLPTTQPAEVSGVGLLGVREEAVVGVLSGVWILEAGELRFRK